MSVSAIGGVVQFFDDTTGAPLVGGKVYTYAAGTTTPQSTYPTSGLTSTSANANPTILDAYGKATLFFLPLNYKIDVQTSAGVSLDSYPIDNVPGSLWPGLLNAQGTLAPVANANGLANQITATINKAGTGTHALFAGTYFAAPTIGAGASALTESATVYIAGPPIVGTSAYALRVASGTTKLGAGGDVTAGEIAGNLRFTSGPATDPAGGTRAGVVYPQVYGDTGVSMFFGSGGPTQTTSAQLGLPVYLWASDGKVASGAIVGAAGGGFVDIRAGDAVRTSSGNADGGYVFISGGAAIGTGVIGYIQLNTRTGVGRPPETGEFFELWNNQDPANTNMSVVRDDGSGNNVNQFLRSGVDGTGGFTYLDSGHFVSGAYPFQLRMTGNAALTVTQVKNFKIAGIAVRGTTEGTNHLDIFDGTAPVGTLANGISLYSTAGELRVMDAAGNATLLSPHDHDTNEWIYDSVYSPTGERLTIRMEQLVAEVERLSGKSFTTRQRMA